MKLPRRKARQPDVQDVNGQDVETERAIHKRLQRFSIRLGERPLWVADQNINDRGVGVDLVLA
ncbi:MAG: hypothetical protein LBJ12_05165 [Oscillospiraceae bacterium]|nr:hypothetical protein [Oscillospiraceae bacterium]